MTPALPFDREFYLQQNPDVQAAGIDPWVHYTSWGHLEGRLPCQESVLVRATGLVDEKYYGFISRDVLDSGMDLTEHYCCHGWRENRRPNLYFDPAFYRAHYNPPPGVAPLTHYILQGERKGYRPCLYFDPSWFRKTYRIRGNQLALEHYLGHRTSQTVSPAPGFDVIFYCERYRKEIRLGRDPFVHYLLMGADRDLDPAPWFSAQAYRASHMQDLAQIPSHWPSEAGMYPLLHFLASRYLPRGQ